MEIVINPDVDIQKCLIDQECKFVKESTSDKYIVLEKDYFTVNVGNIRNIKFDYECRNSVMVDVSKSHINEHIFERIVKSNYCEEFERRDDIFYNKQRPYMLFINDNIKYDKYLDIEMENTIIEMYESIDIQDMAYLVKQKKCHQDFFIVHIDNDLFISCSTHTLNVNYFNKGVLYDIIRILYKDPNVILEVVERKDPPIISKLSFDINGNPILSEHYYLKLINNEENIYDVLYFFDNELCSGIDREDLIVQCVTENDITYLMHQGRYFCVSSENSIILSETLPSVEQRVQFCVEENNRFRLVNKDKYMDIEWVKAAIGFAQFSNSYGVELYLELI